MEFDDIRIQVVLVGSHAFLGSLNSLRRLWFGFQIWTYDIVFGFDDTFIRELFLVLLFTRTIFVK